MKYIRTILLLIMVMISYIAIAQEAVDHDAFMQAAIQKNAAYKPVINPDWGDYAAGVNFKYDYGKEYKKRAETIIIPQDAMFSDSLYHAALEGDSAATIKLAYCYAMGRGVDRNRTRTTTLFTKLVERGQASWKALMDLYFLTGILIINDSLKNKAIEDKYAPYVSLFDKELSANLGYCESLYEKALIRCPCITCKNSYPIVNNIDINLMSKFINYPQAGYACALYLHENGDDDSAYRSIKRYLWHNLCTELLINMKKKWFFVKESGSARYHEYSTILDDLKEYGIKNDEDRESEFEFKFDEMIAASYREMKFYGGISGIKKYLDTPNGKRYKNKELVERALVAFESQDFDADEAFLYIKKKHEEGNPMATLLLSRCYFHGKFVEKNIEKAYELLLKSARANFGPAFFWCGWVAENYYQHTDNNLIVALDAYESAVKLGYEKVKDSCSRIRRKAEIQAKEKRIADARRATAQKRKEYAQKYGVATQQALDNVQIKVGMPFAAIKEYISDTGKNDYSYKLSIDHGSSKCYDIYIEVISAQKIGYVWVTNGKITSVVKH